MFTEKLLKYPFILGCINIDSTETAVDNTKSNSIDAVATHAAYIFEYPYPKLKEISRNYMILVLIIKYFRRHMTYGLSDLITYTGKIILSRPCTHILRILSSKNYMHKRIRNALCTLLCMCMHIIDLN